ncbi:MAG: L,D-transpeptidase, partial [Polyangiaceae bacterium]
MRRESYSFVAAVVALSGAPGCSERAPAATAAPTSATTGTAASSVHASATPPSPRPQISAAARPAKPKVDVWPPPLPTGDQTGDRIYSKVRHLWVRPFPDSRAWLGYLSLGDSVRVKGGDAKTARRRRGGAGRCQWWYAVEPMGFVCAGSDATLDAKDPAVVELQRHAAKANSAWPYHYGESLGVPVYNGLPDELRQRRREVGLGTHLKKIEQARAVAEGPDRSAAILAIDKHFRGVDLAPTGNEPPALFNLGPAGNTIQTSVVPGSTIAFVDSFDWKGRSWILTWDRGIIPRDKVRPFERSKFSGVILSEKQPLPIAFFRKEPRPQYRRLKDGTFEKTDKTWPRLGWVGLSGKDARVDGVPYLETRMPGVWCAEGDGSIARRVKEPPALVVNRKKGRRTWLDISILRGVLVAYEFDKPVYATLISPGRGGLPTPGVPTLDTAATPTGQFGVLGKYLTATMVSGSNAKLVHAEVQFTQNFDGPYALHGAYWHDRWGEKKSGGCVNLAPIDAKRMFEWTEPRLPP